MADETPQEQFDNYKNEMGKQYMDGLISDTEYDELLKAKEAELGLDQPVIASEDEGPECPSCGALITKYDTECNICGIALEPIAPAESIEVEAELDAPPIPTDELDLGGPELDEIGNPCPSCGAEVTENDTVCTMCGNVLGGESESDIETPDIETSPEVADVIDEKPLADEKTCPSCGAFVEHDSTECIICETPLEITVSVEPGVPSEEDELPPEAAPETEVPEEIAEPQEIVEPTDEQVMEIICAGCGAVLDEGITECFICDQVVGEAPEPVPEPEIPVEPEIVEEPIVEGIPVEEDIAEIEDELPPIAEATSTELDSLEAPAEAELDQEALDLLAEVPDAEIVEEIVILEGEIICPSCSSVIPEESDKCPECWTDFSLYVRCPACSLLSPSGEDTCRECFAPLEIPMEVTPEGYIPSEFEMTSVDIEIPDEMEITEELREEMTTLEVEEEQGKECLVCGAIFGPEDAVCPICFMEYGVEVDEPEMIDYDSWNTMDVVALPTKYICPNCGENVTGLDATDREIDESRWFYRGIIMIFSGIFFSSFSILARGINAENASLGQNPPPTDVLLNLIGWALVLVGFMFWFMSWKLHEEMVECQECGIEINPDMANCINCGIELAEDGSHAIDDHPEEEYYEEPVQDEMEIPTEFDEPLLEADSYEIEEPLPDDDLIEELELPVESDEPLPEEPVEPEVPVEAVEPEVSGLEAPEPEAPEPVPEIGAELPTEHEEHKECPGCGIFVDLSDTICPVCDTKFDAVEQPVQEADIEIMSEEDELSGLDLEAEPESVELVDELSDLDLEAEPEMEGTELAEEITATGPIEPEEPVDEATVPEEGADSVECPSCGADVEAGTAICPVCEYPLDS